MRSWLLGALLVATFLGHIDGARALCPVTNTFVSNTTAFASQVNQNFSDLVNCEITFAAVSRASTINLNTSIQNIAASDQWIDGGGTITNGPSGLGGGVLIQFDPLSYSGSSNANTFQTQLMDGKNGQLYWRCDYGGSWTCNGLNPGNNGWYQFITANGAGNVGIGTTSPTAPLEVRNSISGGASLLFGALDGSQSAGQYIFADIGQSYSTNNAVQLMFYYAGSGSASNRFGLGFQGTSELFTLLAGGNVGVGTTGPDTLLTVGSSGPSGNVAHFQNSTGSCYVNPTSTSLSCSSDRRLKKNIAPLGTNALSGVLTLEPVRYNWRNEAAGAPAHTGFIAQDVEKVFPDLVSRGADGYLALNYPGFAPYLTKAVQQQQAEIAELRTALRELKAANDHLRDQVAKIAHAHPSSSASLAALPAGR
jgi:hypothetical protein